MSWSVGEHGKVPAVAVKLKERFAEINCAQPEESIKNSVGEIVAAALAAFPPGSAVSVTACGSQSTDDNAPGLAVNQLTLEIRPLWGFVE